MIAARDRRGLLERRDRCRHKNDFVEPKRFNRLAGKNQMGVMYWVEGAAIDRDLLQSPTVKRSMVNVQLKAFRLNVQIHANSRGNPL